MEHLTKSEKMLKKSQKNIDGMGFGDYNCPVFERRTRTNACP